MEYKKIFRVTSNGATATSHGLQMHSTDHDSSKVPRDLSFIYDMAPLTMNDIQEHDDIEITVRVVSRVFVERRPVE
jgi:hypothetical protein